MLKGIRVKRFKKVKGQITKNDSDFKILIDKIIEKNPEIFDDEMKELLSNEYRIKLKNSLRNKRLDEI